VGDLRGADQHAKAVAFLEQAGLVGGGGWGAGAAPAASPGARARALLRDGGADRDVQHAGVTPHAVEQALDRRRVAVEAVGEVAAIRQHQRAAADLRREPGPQGGEAPHDVARHARVAQVRQAQIERRFRAHDQEA